ncbi:hypothetical protein HK101_003387, partial [Irineochytrium annulatum]
MAERIKACQIHYKNYGYIPSPFSDFTATPSSPSPNDIAPSAEPLNILIDERPPFNPMAPTTPRAPSQLLTASLNIRTTPPSSADLLLPAHVPSPSLSSPASPTLESLGISALGLDLINSSTTTPASSRAS